MTLLPEKPDTYLVKQIFGRIESEHLVPRPRWEFIFKNCFFWTLGALTVAFGAFAFSAALFEIENVDWRLSAATHSDFLTFFLAVAPFLWVFTLILFILIGYINIRRTKHGYRYSLAIIALGAVLTSITLGIGLYTAGFGGILEEFVGDHPPFYRPILAEERSRWFAPEQGLLSGHVVSVAPQESFFALRDFNGRIWEINSDDLRAPDLVAVARGGVVRIIGVPTAATSSPFHACFVFPWETHGSFHTEPPPPPFAAIVPPNGSSTTTERSELCKNIRPYEQLRIIEELGR